MARGGLAATNSILVADETTGDAVLFDAPDNTVGVLLDRARERGWNLTGLWLTHGHFDHIADHAVVTEAFPAAKLLMHRLDEPKLRKPAAGFFPLPFLIPPALGRRACVEDGDVLQIGGIRVEVIFTPGHAPGHVMYHLPEQKVLIGGDLIIGGAVGRTDFPDCSVSDLNNSIRRVMRLPGDTRLLGGHGDPTTLDHELQTNPFVQEAVQEFGGR